MSKNTKICEMAGVREHGEGDPVDLYRDGDNGRLCIVAANEGGFNSTWVDLLDLVGWLSANRDLYASEQSYEHAGRLFLSLPDDSRKP